MTSPALSALSRERYLDLETFKKNGDPVRTPVWFAEVPKHAALYVFTDGTSFKVKRIRRDSRSRIAGCDVRGQRHSTAWFDAKATIVEPGAERDEAYVALRAKYGFQMWLLDIGSRLGGRIGRREVIRLEPA